jgi:hypothetical protein
MNKIFPTLLAACFVAAAPAQALAAQGIASSQSDDPAKLGEARAILAVMFPPAQREAMFAKLQTDLGTQFSVLIPAQMLADPGLKAIFEEFKNNAFERQRAVVLKHFPAQLEAIAGAYAREFSLGDLKDIHSFALTPAGRHYFSKSMSITGDPAIAKVNSETIAELHSVTQQALPPFREKVIAYLKAHPDVAAKIEAAGKSK